MRRIVLRTIVAAVVAATLVQAMPAAAQTSGGSAASVGNVVPGPPYDATYADVADLSDGAPLVVRIQPRKLARIEDERARGLKPGRGRFYIEARTVALVAGKPAAGQELGPTVAFLADLPLDARGRPPVIAKRDVLVFARLAPGRPDQLTLVAPDALLLWTPATNERIRAVVTALLAPDAPVKVTDVREMVNTPGNLAGESETQVFLATADGSAASLTIEHTPGEPPRWGASFSELVAATRASPPRDTLAWYRLACFLPRSAPPGANRSDTPEASAQADADYRFVIAQLGSCPRLRR